MDARRRHALAPLPGGRSRDDLSARNAHHRARPALRPRRYIGGQGRPSGGTEAVCRKRLSRPDRKNVVLGKSVSVPGVLRCCRYITKTTTSIYLYLIIK